MNNEEKSPNIRIPCQHLRSKEMYHQDLGQEEDQYSSGLFWCGKTHERQESIRSEEAESSEIAISS